MERRERLGIIAVVGPTASGKSALAVALAKRLGGEIVSCDSMQVYCRMDVGTAKPTEEEQAIVTSIIYDQIKQNKPVDRAAFLRVADSLRARGCERLVLGCTELSLLKKEGLDDELFVDSLDVLAYRTILACGKTPVGFPASFAKECR